MDITCSCWEGLIEDCAEGAFARPYDAGHCRYAFLLAIATATGLCKQPARLHATVRMWELDRRAI